MTSPARTIFLGSGGFAVPIVSGLAHSASVDLVAVVTAPTRRGSRGQPTDPPLAVWASKRRLPILRPTRLRARESVNQIQELKPDILVLADYGQIVPPELLGLPRHGALNMHPSLLPRHRGASPIPATILAGDAETGVSLMLMDAGLDSGPLIGQRAVELEGTETAPELEEWLAEIASELLFDSLDPWLDGKIQPTPQAAEGITLTRPLRREDGRLDPALSADLLERQVRAFQPWPGSFVDTELGRIVVWRAGRLGTATAYETGTLVSLPDAGLGLAVGDGTLELIEAQPAGGKRMSGAQLLRGRPALAGARVLARSEADQAG